MACIHHMVLCKIFACFRFHSNIFTFITCPVNSFILWDELSVEKSVIWVVFGKQKLIIGNAIASVGRMENQEKSDFGTGTGKQPG